MFAASRARTHIRLTAAACSMETATKQNAAEPVLLLQMEACALAIPGGEAVVDFAFYKPGQVALLLKDKARTSQAGSATCRLVIFQLDNLPFMQLDEHSNGTNQLSQHVIEVSKHFRCGLLASQNQEHEQNLNS